MNKLIINEKHLSQLPAVELLVAMGYTFLRPKELVQQRQGIILLKQLVKKYEAQKRGLMQKLLTGVWRVKV
jgi:hypothetical protein